LKKKKYILLNSQYFPNLEFFVLIKNYSKILVNINGLYKKRTFRNRCVILDSNGKVNLSVPVITSTTSRIFKDVRIDYSENWLKIHLRSLQTSYGKSPFFSFYKDYIFNCLNKRHNFLIDLNHDLLTLICKFLNLKKSFEYIDEKRLKSYDFDDFRNIVDPKFFYSSRKIYTPYQYKHVFGKDFVPNISIMDLLFSEGPNSLEIINNSDSFEIKPI